MNKSQIPAIFFVLIERSCQATPKYNDELLFQLKHPQTNGKNTFCSYSNSLLLYFKHFLFIFTIMLLPWYTLEKAVVLEISIYLDISVFLVLVVV